MRYGSICVFHYVSNSLPMLVQLVNQSQLSTLAVLLAANAKRENILPVRCANAETGRTSRTFYSYWNILYVSLMCCLLLYTFYLIVYS